MPNVNDVFPSKFLKASDLGDKEPVVTIDRVDFEPVGRTREMKAVVYFKGKDKGIVLNKTNANKIVEIAGSAITEEWAGTLIKLYATETEFAGETVECIRIKSPNGKAKMQRMTPKPPPPPVSDDHTEPVYDDDIPF